MIDAAAQTFGIALLACAPALGVLALLACIVGLQHRRATDAHVGEDDTGPDDGGGNQRRRDRPREPSGGDPAWWPEFERAFADYVAACGRPSGDSAPAPVGAL